MVGKLLFPSHSGCTSADHDGLCAIAFPGHFWGRSDPNLYLDHRCANRYYSSLDLVRHAIHLQLDLFHVSARDPSDGWCEMADFHLPLRLRDGRHENNVNLELGTNLDCCEEEKDCEDSMMQLQKTMALVVVVVVAILAVKLTSVGKIGVGLYDDGDHCLRQKEFAMDAVEFLVAVD